MRGATTRRLSLLLVAAIWTLALGTASAQAEITFQGSFGSPGVGAGTLNNPAGIAIDNATGNVYVVDRNQNRIEQFTAAGAFVRMWGYDVVASGEDNKPLGNEIAEVRIRATGGSFALRFEGESTAELSFDATAGDVQTALNGLSKISEGGGSVVVSGGPGDITGSNPYVVTFNGGPLATKNLALEIEPSGLGVPPGMELRCQGQAAKATAIAYQWLAGGTPIPGATAPTYTPTAEEEGKALQCQVAATLGITKTLAASQPYLLASPAPAMLPPLGPASLSAPTGQAVVESLGGEPLTCNAETWTRDPEAFTYQWYRDGMPIGPAITTTETSNQRVLTQAELLTRGTYQCAVTATNAGGSSTAISGVLVTTPKPENPEAGQPTATVTIATAGASRVITRANGGAVFEVCRAKPPSNDTCKAGVAGNGIGQFNAPRSIAVDNSPGGAGAVYVMDDENPRVQKFSSEGAPILLFGKGVNGTVGSDVCTIASGDACGPGVRAKGNDLSPGAFGFFWPPVGPFDELGNLLGTDPGGNVYVGDQRLEAGDERIQKFDSSGVFLSQAKLPAVFSSPGFQNPVSLAVDSAERAYVSMARGERGVERFSPEEFSASGDDAQRTGNLLHEEREPTQLAIDPSNDRLLISDRNDSATISACGGAPGGGTAIVEYDPQRNQIDCTIPTGPGVLPKVTGMAVSPAGVLYLAVGPLNVIKTFKLPKPKLPGIAGQSVSAITTESAVVHGLVNPGFEDTTYTVQFGTEPCSSGGCEEVTGGVLHGLKDVEGLTQLSGLAPNTTYRFRIIAQSSIGKATGPERTFTTFPLVDLVNDPCPNALARKQTKAVALLDCRAYELASASFSGGYDVQSNLIPGQVPFDSYREAEGRLLYGMSDGGIPDTGQPTNRGLDPYLATRGADGWSTTYVGIPADNPFSVAPFSSTLAGVDGGLETFAFAGPEICNPCFADDSAGIPVHLPDGSLIQGMTGSSPDSSAAPSGYVAQALSPDGRHLIFGSTSKLEPAGNEGTLSIYDRDLEGGTTQVVSTFPDGSTIAGEAAALGVSDDGSRVAVGEELSTDSAGNAYYHPYLHLGTSPNSIDLAPDATTGVLFAGMSSDGAEVFFTSPDKLTGEDTDGSTDLYRAEVDAGGTLSLSLLSTGATPPVGNSDACDPAPNADGNNWNAVGGASANGCGVVALGGGAGIAPGDGSAYFLSPEKLDGSGALSEPNLFLVRPGSSPRFVATLEPDNPLVQNALQDSELHRYGDFQVTDNGDYAAFGTTLPLKVGYDNASRAEVYRYDALASEGELVCVSCSPTEAQPTSDASLPQNGSGLTEDGRVFFNTAEQLTLRDTNGKFDAYEWKLGAQQLISTGTSAFPSGLLGVSADGTDAFFFTRDVLVPEDQNGQAMKVYDAREGGGFFVVPPPPPCAASDECHGPGSQAAPPPPIGSLKGSGGQFKAPSPLKCAKGKVKRRGRCVPKKKARSKKRAASAKRGGTR